MWMLTVWLMAGCREDTSALEARVDALETKLVHMELRLDDLEIYVYSETFGVAPDESAEPEAPEAPEEPPKPE